MRVIFFVCFLTISNFSTGQKIEFSNPKDEYDITNEMSQLLIHLKFQIDEKMDKVLYINKVEDGVIHIDASHYTREEKDLINIEIDHWISFSNISSDERTSDLTYDFGVDTDWYDLHPVDDIQAKSNEVPIKGYKKMPNQRNCEELEALQMRDLSLLPENYSGVVKCCRNGKISHIWNFKNGELSGKEMIYDVKSFRVQEYILDDSIITEKNYIDGVLNGQQRKWLSSSNGVTNGFVDRIRIQLYQYNYIDGKLEGLQWECYENGQLKFEKNYTGNQINGYQREWYENGQLNYEKCYKENKLDSIYRKWLRSGQIDFEEHYVNGKLNGLQKKWDINGQLEIERNYKEGALDGLYREWYENGKPETERNYKADKLDGLYIRWNSDGRILKKNNYKEGIKDGLQQEWFANGQLYMECLINDGSILNKKCWDQDGNLIKCSAD